MTSRALFQPVRRLSAVLAISLAALTAPSALAADEAAIESHGISSFGELKYAPDFTHFDYVNPDAPKGGELRLRPSIATRTFDSFNPYVVKGDAAAGARFLFDSLMARAFDEPDALYGLVAERVTMPPDRSYAEFFLRPEARFSDGSPITPEDVVWSLTTLRDEGTPQVALPLRPMTSAEVTGPSSLKVTFAEGAQTRDLPALVAQAPIFSKADFADRAFDSTGVDDPPLGSGPYGIGDTRPGRSVTYELRDDYWARNLPVNRGQWNFAKLTYEYFLDHDVALEAFAAGEFDLNESYRSLNWATKYTFPAVQDGRVIKEVLPDGRPTGTQGFWFNTRRAKLADPRTREALAMAFDFEWTNEKLFYGLYDRTDSFFENSDLQPEGEPSAEELLLLEPFRSALPDAVFGPPATPPVTDGSGADRRVLRRATRLLREAGWSLDGGVLRNAEGATLELEFLEVSGGGLDRIVRPFIANLEQLGVRATLRSVDAAQFERRLNAHDFDVTISRFVLGPTPGSQLRSFLGSASRDAEGSFNRSGIADPAVDGLIEAVEQAQSRAELKTAASALDRVFRAGHYWAPNWYKGSHTIAYWDMFGRPMDLGIEKPPYDRGIVRTWWVDAEKAAALEGRRR